MAAEERRIYEGASEREGELSSLSAVARPVGPGRPGKRVAVVFAYGSAERVSEGGRLATLATEELTRSKFPGALMKAYHELVAGDAGTAISFEIYFDE